MILKQGFHHHPKTVILRGRGGSAAVEALQQLWLFAENARTWQFPNWTREFVAAVGSIYGKPDLADLLLEVGFIDAMPDGGFALHDFHAHNGTLVQRWENGRFGRLGGEFGKLGGRPKNPRETPGGGFGKPPVGGPKNPPTRPDQTRPVEKEKEASSAKPIRPAPPDDESWLQSLEKDPTYAGLDVRRLRGKMLRWCEENRKQPTRRRFINWLNREDPGIGGTGANGHPPSPTITQDELRGMKTTLRNWLDQLWSRSPSERPQAEREIEELKAKIAIAEGGSR